MMHSTHGGARRDAGRGVAWAERIDALTDQLRVWLSARAARLDPATLQSIAAAAARLANVASDELEARAHRAGIMGD
jgi:hypothetical protein